MSLNSMKIKSAITLKPNAVPTNPENGDVYYDSTANLFYFYQNGVWVGLSGAGGLVGEATISGSATSVVVSLGTTLASNSYYVQAQMVNTTDANPQFQPVTITAKTTTTFTATWNAPTATANYKLDWSVPNAGVTAVVSPMTTAGDLILGGTSGVATRLGIGANNTVLTSNGTTASWVAASGLPNVNMHVNSPSGAVNGTAAQIFSSVDWDTNSAYNVSTGKYTAPVTGKYQVNAALFLTATTFAANNYVQIQLVRNTTLFNQATTYCDGIVTGANGYGPSISDIISVTAGDTIWIRANSNATSPTSNSLAQAYFSLALVGT